MSEGVKPRRRYDSSRRQEQASENRRAVLEAARRMFLERGYAGTTVGAIPGEARVSQELEIERLTGMEFFARHLHEGGHLRPGVTVAEARGVMWTCNSA